MAKKPATETSAARSNTETATRPTSTRLYLISRLPGPDDVVTSPIPVALVEASSPAKAIDYHTGAHTLTAKYAEQADLYAAAKAGIEVKYAPKESAS